MFDLVDVCDFAFWCVIRQRWVSPSLFSLVSCAALTLTQSVSVLQIFMTSTFIQLIPSFVHRGKTLKAREGYRGCLQGSQAAFLVCQWSFSLRVHMWRDAAGDALLERC